MEHVMPHKGEINTFTSTASVKQKTKNANKMLRERKKVGSGLREYFSQVRKEQIEEIKRARANGQRWSFSSTSSSEDHELEGLLREQEQKERDKFEQDLVKFNSSAMSKYPAAILMINETDPEIIKQAQAKEGTILEGVLITQVINGCAPRPANSSMEPLDFSILKSTVQILTPGGLYIISRRGTDSEMLKIEDDLASEYTECKTTHTFRYTRDMNNLGKIDINHNYSFLKNKAWLLPVSDKINIKDQYELEIHGLLSKLYTALEVLVYSGDEFTRRAFYDYKFEDKE